MSIRSIPISISLFLSIAMRNGVTNTKLVILKKKLQKMKKKCKPKTKKRKISFFINELCPEGTI